ncbi:MAG: hypothetical protein M3Q98_10325 [Actinomycetota bacterium]|nr:hypothetical protein [Actinomycetota bacterium]
MATVPVVATIAAIWLTAAGCVHFEDATSDGANCSPPTGVQTIEKYSKQVCEGERPERLPVASMAQLNEIISRIQRLWPELGIDPDRFGQAVMSVCVSLLGDASRADIAPHAAEWFSGGKGSLSLAQSKSIVDLIETQGWCVM